MGRRTRLLFLTALGVLGAAAPFAPGCGPRTPAVTAPHRDVDPPLGAPQSDAPRLSVTDAMVLGREDAPVTVLAFVHPHDATSARVASFVRALRRAFRLEVRVALRVHHGAVAAGQGGPRAALALYAAHAQGQLEPVLEALATAGELADDESVVRLATSAAPTLDAARFRAALSDASIAARVASDVERSRALRNPEPGPVFYVNGTRVHGAYGPERYAPLVRAALEAARSVQPASDAYRTAVEHPVDDPAGTPAPGAGQAAVRDPRVAYRVPLEGAPAAGNADALVTLALFEDFTSPECAALQPRLQELRDRYAQDLRVVWRALPSWRAPASQLAAEAAFEAHAQGGDTAFWRFHGVVFAHRGEEGGLTREALERHAHEAGLDEGRFRAALDAHTHAARVYEDLAVAARLGLTETPALLLNGRLIEGAQPTDLYVTAVQRAITEANAVLRAGTPRNELYAQLTREMPARIAYLGAFPDGEPVFPVADDATGPLVGRPGASVTVIHFADLEAPAEVQRAPMLAQLPRAYGERVRVIYRELPDESAHPHAQLAAESAREAFAQRGFVGYLRFRDAVLRNQSRMERADFEAVARAQGLNPMRFREAMNNRIRRADVAGERALAAAVGAQITAPSTFVNGRLFGPSATPAEIQQFVNAQIERAQREAQQPARPAAPTP